MEAEGIRILEEFTGNDLGGIYMLTVSAVTDEEHKEHRSYGICIRLGERQAAVADLSPDRGAVRELAVRCARGDAVPEQLPELAEDFLAALYG